MKVSEQSKWINGNLSDIADITMGQSPPGNSYNDLKNGIGLINGPERLETIAKYKPDFEAIGQNGFSGYVVFGFKDKGLYVFESANVGNATYIVRGDWESVLK